MTTEEPPRSRALATASLVLGLCGLLPILGIVTGLTAVILGIIALIQGQGRLAVGGIVTGILLPLFVNGLFVVLVPTVGRARGLAKRAICGANLNSIGKGIALYQGEFEDSFPWITDFSQSISLADATARPAGGADTVEELAEDTSNIVENLNCLVRQASVSYKVFRCPSVGSDIAEERIAGRAGYNDPYGFWQRESPSGPGKYYCDYAYHIGYPTLSGGSNPAPINDQMDGGFALAADAGVDEGNPPTLSSDWNHETDGVNVLMASLSVRWVLPLVEEDSNGSETYYPLVADDNIYGNGGPDAGTDDPKSDQIPTGEQDQVLHSPR